MTDNQDTTLDHIMRLGLEPAERFKSLITAWATEYFATPLCERIQELEAARRGPCVTPSRGNLQSAVENGYYCDLDELTPDEIRSSCKRSPPTAQVA
jgi:hypothetical protein